MTPVMSRGSLLAISEMFWAFTDEMPKPQNHNAVISVMILWLLLFVCRLLSAGLRYLIVIWVRFWGSKKTLASSYYDLLADDTVGGGSFHDVCAGCEIGL